MGTERVDELESRGGVARCGSEGMAGIETGR